MDLGSNERVERKETLRSPAAPSLRDSSVERERSSERREPGTYANLHSPHKIRQFQIISQNRRALDLCS